MRHTVAPCGLLIVALLSACESGKASSPASAPPSQEPASSPPPAAPAPAKNDEPLPAGIPRLALAHRDNFIRIWRYYFGMAQTPVIGFAQVHQESRWRPTARSKYASGLAQFTPATAADFAKLLPAEVQARCPSKAGCPIDPNWALNALSLYDYRLHKSFKWAATEDDRWRLALAAYNGGAGWIIKERARAGSSTRWADIVAACMRSEASCRENREYPVQILERWRPLYHRWLGL